MMRQIAWCSFQIALSFAIYHFWYVGDPNIDLKKHGGQAAFVSFFMSALATWLLVELFDFFARLSAKMIAIQDKRTREREFTLPAARRAGELPQEVGRARIGQDRG